MIYVLNKNKIISYMVASCIVIVLFASSSVIPNSEIQLLKVSTDLTENSNDNNIMNNY